LGLTLARPYRSPRAAQEEDRIIVAEVAGLKRGLADRGLTGKRLREYLVRVIYVEMLGHDASFGYMKAVEVRERGARGRRPR
jgi:AP-4 complex subunit epsilon-1